MAVLWDLAHAMGSRIRQGGAYLAFLTQGLSFFMEAYTLLRCFSNSIAEQAGHRFSHEMHGTDSGSVVRLMKAMTKLGQDDDQLFSSIAAELLDRGVHLLTPQASIPLEQGSMEGSVMLKQLSEIAAL